MRRKTEYRYKKLANLLRNQIMSGLIKPGEYIMPEHELSSTYGMSRTSVRQSLDELVYEGLIEKEVGRGTKVKPGLIIEEDSTRMLKILAPQPSSFMEYAFSIILDVFKREFPQVSVQVVHLPRQQYHKSIRMTDNLGFKPDLIFVTNNEFMQTVDNVNYHELAIESLLKQQSSKIYPKLLNLFHYNGKLMGAPFTFSPVFLTYNADLFRKHEVELPKPDWTVYDFIRAAAQLTLDTNGDGITDLYGMSISTSLQRWPVFLLRNGATRLGTKIDSDILQDTLTFFHELIYRYKIAHLDISRAESFEKNPFMFGKVAMSLITLYEMSYWKQNSLQFEPMIAPMPFGKYASTIMGANAMVIPNHGPCNNWANKFIEIALREEVQQKICEKTSFLSVYESVNERVKGESFLRKINVYRDMIDQNYFLDELVSNMADLDNIQNAMLLFWYGMESAENTAKQWKTADI